MSTRPSTPVLVAGAALAVLLAGATGWLATRPHPAPGSQGIAGRVHVTALDSTPRQLNDGCFISSRLQHGGRDAALKERYVLTMTLKDDPGSLAALVATLNRPQCSAAVTDAISVARGRLKSDPRFGTVTVSYRTSAGTRVQLP